MDKVFDCVLLDLDGTITDPMLGITRCVEYALNHFGIQVDDLQELCGFTAAFTGLSGNFMVFRITGLGSNYYLQGTVFHYRIIRK